MNLRSSDIVALKNGKDILDEAFLQNASEKDKRIIKMLQTELVDPEKLIHSRQKGMSSREAILSSAKVVGVRSAANTLSLKKFQTLSEMQQATMDYIELTCERLKKSEPHRQTGFVLYVDHGYASKSSEELKTRYRAWFKSISFVQKISAADKSEGGDEFSVALLDLSD